MRCLSPFLEAFGLIAAVVLVIRACIWCSEFVERVEWLERRCKSLSDTQDYYTKHCAKRIAALEAVRMHDAGCD